MGKCPECESKTEYVRGATTHPDPPVDAGLPFEFCSECGWSEMVSETELKIGGEVNRLKWRVEELEEKLEEV